MQQQTSKLTRRYRDSGRNTLQRVRSALDGGADWVATGKRPLAVLTEKTLKLNRISHNSAARLVRAQARFLEGTVEGTAQRLHAAAGASDMRELVDAQLRLNPATRERVATDVRTTFEILGDTRDDVASLIRETIDDLRVRGKAEAAVDSAADAVEEATDKVRREAKSAVRKATPAKRKTARKTAGTKTAKRRATKSVRSARAV